MEPGKPQKYSGRITKKLQLTKTVYQFTITNETPAELLFTPGQYMTAIIDATTRRQYTFASAPHPDSFELVIDIAPMGPGSQFFLAKKEGERIEYLAPLGKFQLAPTSLKKIFVATGTGIAPFRSMLRNEISNFQFPISNQIQNLNNTIHSPLGTRNSQLVLYWGLRHEDDMYWDSEFTGLAGQYSGFQYFLCLSQPSEKWQGIRGHVTENVLKNEKDLQNCEFYLCGNSAMIMEMKSRLSAQQVKDELIKIDEYY